VWRAGTAAQNWGEAPAPQGQCATPLGLSLSEGLGRSLQARLRIGKLGDASSVLAKRDKNQAANQQRSAQQVEAFFLY
jgi:hypothetical protein